MNEETRRRRGAGRASKLKSLAGDETKPTLSTPQIQTKYLCRRLFLSPAMAGVIASLAFGSVEARP